MNTIVIGRITEVLDTDEYPKTKFVIKATIPGEVENVLATPLDTLDQPEVDEEVVLFRLETIFGYSYVWKKLKLNDDTRLKVLGSVIDITKDNITIKCDENEDSDDPSTLIDIKKDGSISIKTSNKVDIDTDKLNIKTNSTIHESNSTEFKGNGGTFKITGTSIPTTPGPTTSGAFCAIPNCPFTGAPHTGNVINLIQ